MTWADANTWAANLVYQGFADWRLPYASVSAGAGPTTTVIDCSTATELACRDNEMGYMFYHNLGGTLGSNKGGNQTALGGVTLDDILNGYWAGTEFDSIHAWGFSFGLGTQPPADKGFKLAAWAVRSGDVAAAPEPATLLLFGIGALGLALSRLKQPLSCVGSVTGTIPASQLAKLRPSRRFWRTRWRRCAKVGRALALSRGKAFGDGIARMSASEPIPDIHCQP
jgi:hypothetical protein